MSDQYPFFAYLSRMRYINRWGLMRNTFQENIQEHSHMVAVLAHALAVIRRDVFGGDADPGLAAAAALYHDAPEILTGDLPTPIKYYNPDIRDAYREVEQFSAHKLLHMLPEALRPSFAPLLREGYGFQGYIHAKAIPGTSPELLQHCLLYTSPSPRDTR